VVRVLRRVFQRLLAKWPTPERCVEGGGYTFQTPGQLPTYATPNVNGGYTLQQPGRPPTYMHPQ
jgi:hypothetical protein